MAIIWPIIQGAHLGHNMTRYGHMMGIIWPYHGDNMAIIWPYLAMGYGQMGTDMAIICP
jgi:hypothetical protein